MGLPPFAELAIFPKTLHCCPLNYEKYIGIENTNRVNCLHYVYNVCINTSDNHSGRRNDRGGVSETIVKAIVAGHFGFEPKAKKIDCGSLRIVADSPA